MILTIFVIILSTNINATTNFTHQWLDAVLDHASYKWSPVTEPGDTRRDNYAVDILFAESQASSLRAYIILNVSSRGGTGDAQSIARAAIKIVTDVESINPSSDIILPSVLLRADMSGAWMKELSFGNIKINTKYSAYLMYAISLKVMQREAEYMEMYHPADLQNGYADIEDGFGAKANLPTMAFYRSDRNKSDLLKTLEVLAADQHLEAKTLVRIADELNISSPVRDWANTLLY